jgi:formate dehydrogenase major subunit
MGSNMAENHPVGFQWVMEAKQRGATMIHIDPRFTRTSALADRYVAIRPGTDIAFLGGLVNYVLTNGREFRDYVVAYSNAATIITEEFLDTEDLDGYFSGFDSESGSYHSRSWTYEGVEEKAAAGNREGGGSSSESSGGHGGEHGSASSPHTDPTLTHPRCVYQLLKRHFSRYTPEMVSRVCGVPEAQFVAVAETLCANSGRERTSCICYAVGWTHHTTGVQIIRTASILQTLLGNIGRPGGGILALRGHASIQGSTDIPTLFDLLPGYLPMPDVNNSSSLEEYIDEDSSPSGYWGDMRGYVVSLLKAWFGDAASADNDFCFDYLPRLTGDHSAYQTTLAMLDGTVKGYFALGENPAVGSANAGMQRRALAAIDWLVVRDLQEIETASFWYDSPEIASGELRTEDIGTEVFFLPAAAHTEKSGSFTQTQRLLQWHDKAVEPPEDCRSDLWFFYHLGRLVRERLAGSLDERDRPVLDLTWDYPLEGEHGDPDAEAVLAEINGWGADHKPLSSPTELKDDGSTACGCWIYCGSYADGVNQTRRRKPGHEQNWVAPEWGWAWPSNRHLLYNRASADLDGKPWSERKRYVWWDAEQKKWVGEDTPDFQADKAPDYEPPPDAKAEDALSGRDPFIMQSDGKAWLWVPSGLADGPLPAHFEPNESPVHNPVYRRQDNPASKRLEARENPRNDSPPANGEPDHYPFVLSTFRVTEHHTAGGMSRTVDRLSELQPEMFCEVGPDLARERGLTNGGWATILTARGAIEARVLVTERIRPLEVDGRILHQVAIPFHWGSKGLSTGDSANDLTYLGLDPNVFIQDSKSLTCDVQAGRRPRGRERKRLVDEHRDAAQRTGGRS